MLGYSKIKGNNSFIKRSKSNKEFLFLDGDFDLLSSKNTHKKSHLDEHEPSIIHRVKSNRKVDFFFGESNEKNGDLDYNDHDDHDGDDDRDHHNLNNEKNGGVLRRKFSISSTYQKNNNEGINNHQNISLERQSSTRAIQVVKRAFSIRRSSSVNSDRYCRIYDQPIIISDDHNDNHDFNGNYNHNDDDLERNGSFKTSYVSMMKKNLDHNHGRKHVGSRVVKACKRLFSR
ncbi:unnamed protein product [Amaranthus hypochondriacus]